MLTDKGPGSNLFKDGMKFLSLCCYMETVKTNQLPSHTKEHSGKNHSFLTSWSRRTLGTFSASELACNQQQVYNAQQLADSSKARRVDPFLISLNSMQRLLSHGNRFVGCVSVDTCPSCPCYLHSNKKHICYLNNPLCHLNCKVYIPTSCMIVFQYIAWTWSTETIEGTSRAGRFCFDSSHDKDLCKATMPFWCV